MAKFGVKEIVGAALSTALILAPAEANGLAYDVGSIGSVNDNPDHVLAAEQIAEECRGVGSAERKRLFAILNSREFQIGSWTSAAERKAQTVANVCAEADITTYCAGVGKQVRDGLLNEYESSHQSIEATADAQGNEAANLCTDEMYGRIHGRDATDSYRGIVF